MITVTGPRIALAVCIAAGCFVLGMGAFGLACGGLTPHEGLAGTGGLVVAAVAWLWLRRAKRRGGAS